MGNVLILTGVTNNPGRILVEYIAQNYETIKKMFPGGIRAVCRATSNIGHIKSVLPQAELWTCDLTDLDGLKTAFKDASTILHMAGIHWSREVAEAAAYCKAERLIAVHTCGIYSKYKKAGEEYREIDSFVYDICKKNDIAISILRPTMIYGNTKDRNMIKFIKMVDKFPIMPVVNGGKYELQPVNFKDLGKAFYDVLINEQTKNKDYILSGESPILLIDMLSIIGKHLGKKVHFVSCPYWLAYTGAALIYGLTFGKIDFREKVQRLCEPRAYEHVEATKAFGYKPCSFEDGIKNEVAAYRKEC